MDTQLRPPPPPPPPPTPARTGKLSPQPKVPSPVRMIEPTTAGLLQRPLNGTQMEQQVNGYSAPMGSNAFKNELLAKQSRISSAGAASTIDDRIKNRKEEANSWPQREPINRHVHQNGNSFINGHENQMRNMPEKLISTIKGDIRPFSYSIGVNDPSNRGKLDLSQIKSATMRRRLMMNMSSVEEADEETGEEESHNDSNGLHQSPLISNRSFAGSSSDPENVKTQTVHQEVPIVEYKNPPVFYNSNPVTKQSPQDWASVRASTSNDYLYDLDLEVANSLDSLTSLVNSLPQPRISRPTPAKLTSTFTDDYRSATEYQPRSDRVSSFLPSESTINRTRLSSNSRSPIEPYSVTPNRSVGDYLLAPDSSYFSVCSRSEPYSVSPYYGSHLDESNYEGLASNYLRDTQPSSKTFSSYSMNI